MGKTTPGFKENSRGCEFYHEEADTCSKKLPTIFSYREHICSRNPRKCPVFLLKTKGSIQADIMRIA
jgi:hypothetical protein